MSTTLTDLIGAHVLAPVKAVQLWQATATCACGWSDTITSTVSAADAENRAAHSRAFHLGGEAERAARAFGGDDSTVRWFGEDAFRSGWTRMPGDGRGVPRL